MSAALRTDTHTGNIHHTVTLLCGPSKTCHSGAHNNTYLQGYVYYDYNKVTQLDKKYLKLTQQ